MSHDFAWHPLDLRRLDLAARESSQPPVIELVGFPGCPQLAEVRASLAAALSGNGSFAEVNQDELRRDDPRRAYPSPTILVNGRDLFGLPPAEAPATGCRRYPGGLPDAEAVGARLRALVS